MRFFNGNTGWEQARRETRFTVAALLASDVHAKNARPLQDLLGQWVALDAARQSADDALVDAQAGIDWLDEQLDELVAQLAARLRYELGGGVTAERHPIFRRFFPEAPNRVIRLALESEIERTQYFHVVAGEVDVSAQVRTILRSIATVEERAKKAIARRVEAEAEVARIAMRVAAWKDEANAVRRTTASQLEAHAAEERLPRSYAASFFPEAARRRPKTYPATLAA